MMGSAHNIGVDIDRDALKQASENCQEFGNVDLIHMDVSRLVEAFPNLWADTILMNPPFGTKLKGIDMEFLRVATKIAKSAIYSLHKTSTRDHVLRYLNLSNL